MPFSKGDKNINTDGRKKGSKSFTTKVKEALAQDLSSGKQREAEVINTIVTLAMAGDKDMIKLIWNYSDGMPSQAIKNTVELVDGLTDEQKDKLDKILINDKSSSTKESN